MTLIFSLLLHACKKEDVVVVNRQVTPDLSNPVIQKLTENTWYLTSNTVSTIWESAENMPSTSESVAGSILYSLALASIRLYRDGTSVMVYAPPVVAYSFVYARGTWTVSEEHENTIIVATETPVGNSTIKMTVKNMEFKDNIGTLTFNMDHGHRVMEQSFSTITSIPSKYLEYLDYNWIEGKEILTDNLQQSEFVGTSWGNASRVSVSSPGTTEEFVTGISHIEDLLGQTPIFLYGIKFKLSENGKASIAYADVSDYTNIPDILYSDATWYVKGNKIIVNSDEVLFLSVAEVMFGLPAYASGLTTIKKGPYCTIYSQSGRTFAIEIISREATGNWCRVTTNDAVFYAFLTKESVDLSNAVHISDLK
ncbi:MAG: hypothetical protein QM594_11245 [Niabella sp.]